MKKRSKMFSTFSAVLFVVALLSISGYAYMYECEYNDTFEKATILDKNGNYNEKIICSLVDEYDEDYLTFTPIYSGPYKITIESVNSTIKTLYSPSREVIDQTTNNTLLAELTGNCNYYIKIKFDDTNNNTFNMTKTGYTISITPLKPNRITTKEAEYNSSFLSANILPNNMKSFSICGAINQPADEDYYIFTPRISGTYTVETTGNTDTVGCLYDNSGIYNGIMRPAIKEPLTSNDNSNNLDPNFKITYNLSAFKTYYIKVTHKDPNANSGDYGLKISIPQETITYDREGNSISSAYTLYSGTTYSAQMSSSTDVDYFRFSPPTTGNYRIETKGFNNTTGQIYSSAGQLLLSDTDTDDNCVLEMKLQKNIAYYIKITDRKSASGNYTISVTKGKTLSVVKQSQQPYDLLCWATSASMVSAYFNNSTIDRTLEIAKYNKPTSFSYEFNKANDMSNIANGIERYITGYTPRLILKSKFTDAFGTYPIDDIVKAIDMNSPIAFLVDNHCVVGKGYMFHIEGEIGPFIIYNDPWDGQEHTVKLNDFGFLESICYIPTPVENVELEVNDSVFSSDDIKIGIEKVSSINNEGDVDYYKFSAYPGNYTVETFGMTDTCGEVYKGSIAYQSPIKSLEQPYYEYNLIGQDNNSGSNGNFKINFTNTDTLREYYIKVKHSSPYITGNYSIKVTWTSN